MKWGIMGAGNIVDDWIKGARAIDDVEIVAIASRTPERARAMAEKHGIPTCMTYDQMAADRNIETVYIPVPHTAHKELAVSAMENRKHVLVEKPMAHNAKEAKELVACAQKNNVFLMEGMWTRFFPAIDALLKICNDGTIGKVTSINCTFGYRIENIDPASRLVNPELAGGALLDLGVYALFLAQLIFGAPPKALTGAAGIDTDENHFFVDEQNSISAEYAGGGILSCLSAIRTWLGNSMQIYGTKGHVDIPTFWKPTVIAITNENGTAEQRFPVPESSDGQQDDGYQYEIRHVVNCIEQGLTQSPLIPLDMSISILEQCDQLRRQWNLKYPND